MGFCAVTHAWPAVVGGVATQLRRAPLLGWSLRGWGLQRWGWFGVLLGGYLALDDQAQRLWFTAAAFAFAAMVYGFRGLLVHRPTHARGWLLLLLGFSGWLTGDLVWLVESWHHYDRFPAPSDALYLASYLAIGSGVLSMVRSRRPGGDFAAFLDAAILTTGAAVLVLVILISPSTQDPQLGLLAKVAGTAYPIGDVFLLGALTRLLTSPGARNGSYRLLLAALCVTTLTDSAWNIMIAMSGEVPADRSWLNIGWLCAYLLIAGAANARSMVEVAEPAPPSAVLPLGRRRIVALGIGLLLPAAVLLADGLDGDGVNWLAIALGATVMSVLVLIRFVNLLSTVQTQAVRLAALARTDPLTGAPNRRNWDHELARACRFATEHGTSLSVALLDLDHFKEFNDTHGHQAGDQLLRDAVEAWREALPSSAILARYGGEEFAVLLPGHPLPDARRAIVLLAAGTPRDQSFSAGIAEWRPTGSPDDPTALIAAADRALYRAKRGGRNRIITAVHGVARNGRPADGDGRASEPASPTAVKDPTGTA
jgi:diguanylate cyclase